MRHGLDATQDHGCRRCGNSAGHGYRHYRRHVLPPGSSAKAASHLPVGQGTPAISLGERHGLILASDGSLWSWGSDFLGWPVLGLGNVPPQTRLRRIGHDTNWVSISAGTSHNMALKSDGTLWAWGGNLLGVFGVGTLQPKARGGLHPRPRRAGQ